MRAKSRSAMRSAPGRLAAIDCARRVFPLSLARRTRARRSSGGSSPRAMSAANNASHASGVARPVNHNGFAAASAASPSVWRLNWIAWQRISVSSPAAPVKSCANVDHCPRVASDLSQSLRNGPASGVAACRVRNDRTTAGSAVSSASLICQYST
jgi:hypothetical protein